MTLAGGVIQIYAFTFLYNAFNYFLGWQTYATKQRNKILRVKNLGRCGL